MVSRFKFGYLCCTALRDFLQVEYGHHPQVKRLLRSPDGGATDLVLREMTE